MLGRILIAGMASLLICSFLGPKFIEYLREKEFGQHMREEGPVGHHGKAGTPTMGGLIVFLSVGVPFLILGKYDTASLTVFGVAMASAALGFLDDWTKVSKKRSLGLSARAKLGCQAAIAIVLWYVATHSVGLSDTLHFRIFGGTLHLGVLYPILIFLVLAGASNGVTLTHGLAGLAAACPALVPLAYTAITPPTTTHAAPPPALIRACPAGARAG